MTECHECGHRLQEVKLVIIDGIYKWMGHCPKCNYWRYSNYEQTETVP